MGINDIACQMGLRCLSILRLYVNVAYIILGLLYGQGDFGRRLIFLHVPVRIQIVIAASSGEF